MKVLKKFVFSVFSQELQDYPYYPFICNNYSEALSKFCDFVSNRDTICGGAELHCIGTCVTEDGVIVDGSIQPLLNPVVVTYSGNLIGRLALCSNVYVRCMRNYLRNIFKEGKEKWTKKKKKN